MIDSMDYIKICVNNIEKARAYFCDKYGFILKAKKSSGFSRGYILTNADITLVLESSDHPKSPIYHFLRAHGEGVCEVAFLTKNISEFTTKKLLNDNITINKTQCGNGLIETITIPINCEFRQILIERTNTPQYLLPDYEILATQYMDSKINKNKLVSIDHLAIALHSKNLKKISQCYISLLGMHKVSNEMIQTAHSGMDSLVIANKNSSVKLVLVAPINNPNKSQIQNFIDKNSGQGVQHIAFSTNTISDYVQTLKQNGVDFLNIPSSYYQDQLLNHPTLKNTIEKIKDQNILIDTSEGGHLLQIFTKPITQQHTLFLEIIQRCGSDNFGSNNIKALFKGVEAYERNKKSLIEC